MSKFRCPFKKAFDYPFIITKELPQDASSLAYQRVVDNLIYANLDESFKVISVIPTMKNDHQANMVVNLAYLLSQQKKKILVMDLDFRSPRLHVVLNTGMKQGIYDYLFANKEIKECILKDKTYGFDSLFVGQPINSISQVLESKKIKDLIESLKEAYDVILLISPSIATSKDGLLIAKLSDSIVYIVSKKYSNKQVVDMNYHRLKSLNVPILGTILLDYKEKEKILGIPLL